MPTRSMRNLSRALARFFRSSSHASKMRTTASETLQVLVHVQRNRRALAGARHDAEPAAGDDLEPLHAVLDARNEPEVVQAVMAVSWSSDVNATLNLRGKSWESGLRSQ